MQDLDEKKKVEVFSHQWTSWPASLFEPDPNFDQCCAMQKGNKSDFLVAIKSSLGKTRPGKIKEYGPHDTLTIPEWKGFIQS